MVKTMVSFAKAGGADLQKTVKKAQPVRTKLSVSTPGKKTPKAGADLQKTVK